MGDRPKDITPLREEPRRLDEIESLLKYESSISFQSARAHESMWSMVEEIRRCWSDIERLEKLAYPLRQVSVDGPTSTQEAAERYRDDVVL